MHSFILLTVAGSLIEKAVTSAIPYGYTSSLQARAVVQGWSLQSQQCPANTKSCGGGSCCPSSLNCQSTGNGEVWACCPSTSNCRGAVEGNPTCADSSWSLWKGNYGNGFCCDPSLVGTYTNGGSTAGTCVSSVPAGQTSATLMSRGSGGSGSSTSSTRTSTTTSPPRTTTTTSATSTSTQPASGATGKPVFMHYMIGSIDEDHCVQDLQNAASLGVDAFALNIDTIADWSQTTTDRLFNNAAAYNIKLFFSFDMSRSLSDPSSFESFLQSYVTRPVYFKYNGKPLVSTFGGENVADSSWNNFKSSLGTSIVLVPSVYNRAADTTFFDSNHKSWDGLFNWDSWPDTGAGHVSVSSAKDQTWQSTTRNNNKLFMMGMSPLQFKHIDGGQNWYRRGEANLENRIGQVLSLQPDMLEIQTWNDAGESQYMGNSWNEPIAGTPIVAYTQNYPHQGYWQILPSFIQAWKRGDTSTAKMYPTNGKAAQGTFWHHTLLVNGDCSSDSLGKPNGIATDGEDLVSRDKGIILVAQGQNNLKVVATSGGTQLGSPQALQPGYNKFAFGGLTTGTVNVQVKDANNNQIVGASGPIQVANSASLCNYNFQVVGLGS